MKKITSSITDIFFDLDRTLWDFETNSKVALETVYRENSLNEFFSSFILFYERYQQENSKVWQRYYKKEIDKNEVRFLRIYNTLKTANKEFCNNLSQQYIEIAMAETALMPYTKEILNYLLDKKYRLHIITNGFKEVQAQKLANCNIISFFDTVTTSEDAKAHKPHPKAFLHAIKEANTTLEKSAMVGDDIETDIAGAKQIGLLSIYFNPKNNTEPHRGDIEIRSLELLKKIF